MPDFPPITLTTFINTQTLAPCPRGIPNVTILFNQYTASTSHLPAQSATNRDMSSIVRLERPVQRPLLPWEVTDIIIDHLHHDVRALGACGAVCTEWLARSRFHLFSTVQLWPWRIREFVRIADGTKCTFASYISRVEVDGAKERKRECRSREREGARTKLATVTDAMDLKCLTQAAELQIRNVDWTRLPPGQRTVLRAQLARLTRLRRLELDDDVFQDMREIARILSVLPALRHFTANVSFATCGESAHYGVSCGVPSLELGTDDALPLLLGATSGVRKLSLKRVHKDHFPHIQSALRGRLGTHLESLAIHLKR